jgi:type IV fimbrial biogenesis protein FimT
MVFSDDDGDASRGAGEAVVRRAGPNEHAITVRGNRPVADYVSFTAQGLSRLRSGALGMGTFTVCTRGQQAIEVVLANGGRPRIQDGRSVCP